MKKSGEKNRFGDLQPLYHFSMNPYSDKRLSSCPACKKKTVQRKLPLFIHVDPESFIALNYTNRYCENCDLLMAHKTEIEHLLTELFFQLNPELIGNNYIVIGTVEKKAWKDNANQNIPFENMCQQIHDFKSYDELQMTRGGWFPEGAKPPIVKPSPSKEWIQ